MEKLTGWVKENWLSIVLFLLSSGAVVASFFAGLAEVFAAYPAQVLALIGGSLVIGAVLCYLSSRWRFAACRARLTRSCAIMKARYSPRGWTGECMMAGVIY